MAVVNRLSPKVLLVLVPLVAGFEGVSYVAYRDPVGIPTACFGHTAGVKMGQRFTEEECKGLLIEDLNAANAILDRAVKVPLADEQRIPFLSFIYNVGPGKRGVKDGFVVLKNGNPSTMLRKLNAGDYRGACEEFPKWGGAKIAGIKVTLPGLVTRRAKERQLCLEAA